ncbi:MAG TPA: hypothetical protein VMR86_10010 [Myxococcota bacterium]|nr:hypothetical protein [Myxococcota bacterium]
METTLRDLLRHARSRSDAADWARAVALDALEDDLSHDVVCALQAADRCEGDLDRTGAPYFIRDADLREWLACLRGEDLDESTARGLRVLRAHQMRPLSDYLAALDCKLADLAARAGLRSFRGWDDLDFYEAVLVELPSGHQVTLIDHARSTFTLVHLERTVRDTESALGSLLSLLELDRACVVWTREDLGW